MKRSLIFAVAVLALTAVIIFVPIGTPAAFGGDISCNTAATSAPAIATPATAIGLSSSAQARAGPITFGQMSLRALSTPSTLTTDFAIATTNTFGLFVGQYLSGLATINKSVAPAHSSQSFDLARLARLMVIQGGQVADRLTTSDQRLTFFAAIFGEKTGG